MLEENNCYCGNATSYTSCCEAIHLNKVIATTAESLMRSRYSAFVIANGDYLVKSHHHTTRPSNKEKKSMVRWAKSVNWIKLEVLQTTGGSTEDTEGTVEFKAFYYEDGRMQMIHEHSKFLKENGHWLYYGEI